MDRELLRERRGEPGDVPPVVAIGQFVAVYGPGFYIGPWPTADTVIPYKLFYVFHAALRHVRAFLQSIDTQSQTLAIAAALNGKDAKVQRALRELAREAFPGA